VAGTIAAATNNGTGVAGVSWGAKILPVRVLGVDGGSTSDIIDGILWAAGVPIVGVPFNENPAQIINLSLGGAGLCETESSLQRAFDQVNAKGTIVVVAAGNENVEAAETVPASCSGVITVGATTRPTVSNPFGTRASYSNFGPRVDVMAPGGNHDASSTVNDVLSLGKNDTTHQFIYDYKAGTSMATPHVAGVLALLKSKTPSLNFSRALSILKRTAHPLTTTQCTGTGTAKLPSDCGAGQIDAQRALIALDSNPDFSLTLNPSSVLGVRGQAVQIQINQSNYNGFATPASVQLLENIPGLTSSISNNVLSLTPGATLPFGAYTLHVRGSAGGLTREASLSLNVIDVNAPVNPLDDISGTDIIFCNYVNDACDRNASKIVSITKSGSSFQYSVPELTDGNYLVLAWKDVNGNHKIDEGDLWGGYSVNNNFVFVRPPATNIDMEVFEIVSGLQNSTSVTQLQLLMDAIGQTR
jgi:serine protease